MKYMLYITGLLCFYLLFYSYENEIIGDNNPVTTCEAIMKEKNSAADMQHRIEAISNDLKNSNCRTPRRNIQPTNTASHSNVLKSITRTYDLRLKGADQLRKVFEYTNYCQTSNYSALLCRMGYHVYALRKILI